MKHPLCIVHWGMPKTGSTSIQATLLQASPLQGATFLNVGIGNSSRLLATLFMDDPGAFHLNRKWDLDEQALAGERQQALALLARQIRSAGPGPCILSAEVVSTLDEAALGRLRSWLDQHFEAHRLVGYVRPPRGYLESEFQQKIKAGRGRFKPENNYPGYAERFGKLERVFGRERVDYWLFDPARFPAGDVVRDFLQRLALRVPEAALQRSNESLGRDALSLLYIYRKHGPGYGAGAGSVEQNRRLQRALRELGGPRLRLAEALIGPILDAQAEDIAWMSERLGVALREPARADAPEAIRTEADLLQPGEAALRWLAAQLGPAWEAQVRPDLPLETIAEWMHALRLRLAPQDGQGRPRDRSRLIQQAPAEPSPAAPLGATELLGAAADAPAVRALDAVLRALGRRLAVGQPCRVPGLGRFSLPERRQGSRPPRLRFEPEAPEDRMTPVVTRP